MRFPRPLAAVVICLALVAGCRAAGTPSSRAVASPSISGVQVYPGLTHGHKAGAHIVYPQSPPVGGDHAPYWLTCAVYDSPVPNEYAVHSMEHGAVWLTYQPGVAPTEVAKLTSLAKIRPDYTIVSPFPGQASPVVATAWGLQLSVSTASDPRVMAFVDQYAGGDQGGEPGVTCGHGLTPAQAFGLYKN